MAESNSTSVARLGELLAKLALELNFIEPGKDSGLLPINRDRKSVV